MEINENDSGFLLKTITKATKAVPSVKYALGVVGVASGLMFIVGISNLKLSGLFFGTLTMFFFMILLLVFSFMASSDNGWIKYPSIFLLWGTVLLSLAFGATFYTSIFWKKPQDLSHYLTLERQEDLEEKEFLRREGSQVASAKKLPPDHHTENEKHKIPAENKPQNQQNDPTIMRVGDKIGNGSVLK
ncbi:hypothetical protein APED_01335 [Acanthopleuribacter pedis]